MYEREVTPSKKEETTQRHDRRAMRYALACWGDAVVTSLDRRDWDRFIQRRRAGTLGCVARDGTIATNLRLVVAVLNWATKVRVNGQPMLAQNPFRGCPMPRELSPRQPEITEAEYHELVTVAPRVHPYCPLFLVVAHETGRRGNSIRQLRWSDIDFARQRITWRASTEKTKAERTTPMSDDCAAALLSVQRSRRAIGDAWVFPSKRDPRKPVDRFRVRDWWRRLVQLSGIEEVPGRGWHSLRRKFATDYIDLPLKELMALVGWKNVRTAVDYQKPREDRLRQALSRRNESRRANGQ